MIWLTGTLLYLLECSQKWCYPYIILLECWYEEKQCNFASRLRKLSNKLGGLSQSPDSQWMPLRVAPEDFVLWWCRWPDWLEGQQDRQLTCRVRKDRDHGGITISTDLYFACFEKDLRELPKSRRSSGFRRSVKESHGITLNSIQIGELNHITYGSFVHTTSTIWNY